MPLKILGRRKDLSPEDRDYIESKIDRLRKLTNDITVMDVFVDEFRSQTVVKMVVKAGAIELAIKDTDQSVSAAFDRVLEKMERGIKRAKSKRWGRKKHLKKSPRVTRQDADLFHPVAPDAEDEEAQEIIAIERIPFKPMSVEEAAEQIEVNGSSLLVFTNDVSEKINVLYRRDDGHFGLIEPS